MIEGDNMRKKSSAYLLWIIAAGVLSFAVAAVFAGLLRMPRSLFLVPYVILTGIFAVGYFRWSKVDMQQLITHNWLWGLLGALLLGFFVVKNVLSQPASPSSQGVSLMLNILWLGVVYGMTDAILLSVIPVLAVWQAFSQLRWTTTLKGKTVVGAFAVLASLFITFAYHWGYPEYRGLQVMAPLVGNGMMSLGYLLTNNPITAIGSHIAMHIAAVLHGPATAIQMPPHYF
jgi:hypothetical protein